MNRLNMIYKWEEKGIDMPVDEGKINQAFALIEEAEGLVNQIELAKAIFKLQKALDLFDKSGMPPAKKRQAMDMVSNRQAEVALMKKTLQEHPEMAAEMQAQAGGSASQDAASPMMQAPNPNVQEAGMFIAPNFDIPPNYDAPPVGQPMIQSFSPMSGASLPEPTTPAGLEAKGMALLDQAASLVGQQRYLDSIHMYYQAAEILIQAGWPEDRLLKIQDEVTRVSQVMQQAEAAPAAQPQVARTQPMAEQSYTPTFAQVGQGQQPMRPNTGYAPAPEQAYVPTFMQTGQADIAPRGVGIQQTPQQVMNNQQYTPTFAQLQQGAPAFKPAASNYQAQNQAYVPTFIQTGQADIAPRAAMGQPAAQPAMANQQYTPTYAQFQQGTPAPKPAAGIYQAQNQAYVPTFMQTGQTDIAPRAAMGQPAAQPAMANQQYTPTFAQLQQGTLAVKPVAGNYQAQNQAYVPTFMQTGQSDIAPQQVRSGATQQNAAYIPTYAQVQQGAPAMKPAAGNFPAQNQAYVPTFMQTGQNDIASAQLKMQPTAAQTEYTPTFASVTPTKAEGIFDPNEFQKMMVAAKSGVKYEPQTPTFAQVGQGDVINAKGGAAPVQLPEGPSFAAVGQQDFVPYQASGQKIEAQGPSFAAVGQRDFVPYQASEQKIEAQGPSFAAAGQQDYVPYQATASTGDQATPSYVNIEQKAQLEQTARSIMEDFERQQESVKSMQEEAFKSIDDALQHEKGFRYQSAIDALEDAISMLNTLPGWANQGMMMYARVSVLQEKIRLAGETGKMDNPLDIKNLESELLESMRNIGDVSEADLATVHKVFSENISAAEMFQFKIDWQNKQQDEIFLSLDKAQLLAIGGRYDEAISAYNKIILSYNALAWINQAMAVQDFISNLNKLREISEQSLTVELAPELTQGLSKDQLQSMIQKQAESRKEYIKKLEDQKINQHQAEEKAFAIIGEAEKDIAKKEYGEALNKYENAVSVLITAGWQTQLPMINDRIAQVRREQEEFIKQKQASYKKVLDKKTEDQEFSAAMQRMAAEQQEKLVQQKKAKDIIAAQQKKLQEAQNTINSLLEEASKALKKNQFTEAIASYQKAKVIVTQNGWGDQSVYIDNSIKSVNAERDAFNARVAAAKAKEEEERRNQSQLKGFLEQQAAILQQERDRKRKQLEDFQRAKQSQQQTESQAYEKMSEAEQLVKMNKYDDAIECYKKASMLFGTIGWKIDVTSQIQKVFIAKTQYQETLSQAEQAKIAEAEQARFAELQKTHAQQKEISALMDIKSMLKGTAKKEETKAQIQDARKTERDKMRNEMLSWRSKSKSMLSSLKDEILSTSTGAVDAVEKAKNEEKKKAEVELNKAKQEMDSFKKLIREAAEKDKKKPKT